MKRLLRIFLLGALLLVGCRRGSPPTTPTPVVPTPAPTTNPEMVDAIARAYTALLLIEGSIAVLDDLAGQLSQGSSEDAEAYAQGVLAAVGGVLSGVDATMKAPSPVPELSTIWGEARQVLPAVTIPLSRWQNGEITADRAPAALKTARDLIQQILARTETALSEAYGLDAATLQQIKEQAIAQLDAAVAATPQP